ncbi:MAG: DUF4184 family protein [Candidatus Riflebacteria bacterium]|nr:DUF4184 family protein [Candidatus Riflebacteria bacterium]
MPFTIVHAAAALPIRWLSSARLPLAALVVGSMSPDFEYPFRLAAVGRLGHTTGGIFTFCLPVGMAALVFFEYRLWPWVVYLAPGGHRERLVTVPPCRPQSLQAIITCAVAIVVGAASHLAWDAFTHRNGWVVQQVPMLKQRLVSVGGLDIHVYQLLQQGSTVLGLLVLALAYSYWYRHTMPAPIPPDQAPERSTCRTIIGMLIVVPVVGGVLLSAWSLPVLPGSRLVAVAAVQFVVGWIATLAVCLAALGIAHPSCGRRVDKLNGEGPSAPSGRARSDDDAGI